MTTVLRLLPVTISFLLLTAHFLRAGQWIAATICLSLPLLLILKVPWVPRVLQVALLLGAMEWLRTLYVLVQLRVEWGQPWARLALILGAVVLFTALAGLSFRAKGLRQRYRAVK